MIPAPAAARRPTAGRHPSTGLERRRSRGMAPVRHPAERLTAQESEDGPDQAPAIRQGKTVRAHLAWAMRRAATLAVPRPEAGQRARPAAVRQDRAVEMIPAPRAVGMILAQAVARQRTARQHPLTRLENRPLQTTVAVRHRVELLTAQQGPRVEWEAAHRVSPEPEPAAMRQAGLTRANRSMARRRATRRNRQVGQAAASSECRCRRTSAGPRPGRFA